MKATSPHYCHDKYFRLEFGVKELIDKIFNHEWCWLDPTNRPKVSNIIGSNTNTTKIRGLKSYFSVGQTSLLQVLQEMPKVVLYVCCGTVPTQIFLILPEEGWIGQPKYSILKPQICIVLVLAPIIFCQRKYLLKSAVHKDEWFREDTFKGAAFLCTLFLLEKNN